MLRYQNNAFRILGLNPNVSMKEIMQRVNEFKVKKSLDMNVVYEYDFPWMGPLDRSEQNIRNALQSLDNPVSRLREEIFWFWFVTDCDKKAINYLKKNNHQAAHKTWNALITSENPTKESMSASINQTILVHSSIIGEECEEKEKNQNKKSATLSEKHWKNWKFVINQFTLLASNEVFWEMIKNKAEKIDDPRLSSSKVDDIRNNFLQDIAEPNFALMSDALILKEYEIIKQHSSLLTEGWIPNDSLLPSEVLRKGFNKILASHTDLLNRYAQNTAKELRRVEKGDVDAGKVIIDIYCKLIDNVADIIYEGSLVDPNSISDFALAKNEIAKIIRSCAVKLYNILTEDTNLPQEENKVYKVNQAYEMIRKALEYASTNYTKQQYEKDEEVLKNILETERGNYHTQKLNKQPLKSSNWGCIFSSLFWGAIILFFFIIPNLPDNSSSNKATISTPPYSSSKPTTITSSSSSNTAYIKSQNDLSQLKIRIDNLAETIKKKETKILEFETTLKAEGSKIEALESELKKLDLRIEGTTVGVGKNIMIEEYNQKIEQHDTLVNSYNKVYSEYGKLYDECEEDIITHDSLVESYNAGIIPQMTQSQLSEGEVRDKIYIVEVGDSLGKIAQKFGTTTEKIVARNKLVNPSLIRPGQKLIIPTE